MESTDDETLKRLSKCRRKIKEWLSIDEEKILFFNFLRRNKLRLYTCAG